ncbi:HAD hydrolase-like protein, partial [Streptomyces rhizosphaericus]|uniref:HAD hydrolase-like protein n=1 Tax=Streptomyces rhizosphaericus TaxID=114699 RepID=UPI0031D16224
MTDPTVSSPMVNSADVPASEIVFVGDRLDKDVIGPWNAGMRAVLVDSRRPPTAAPETRAG